MKWGTLCGFLLAIAMLLPGSAVAADGVLSIESLVKLEADWPKLVGTPLRVEGRYLSMGRDILRFTGCSLVFRLKETPTLPRTSRVLQVTGQLRNGDQGLYFDVEQVKQRPSDLDTFRTRKSQLRATDPDEWYELGRWARGRARFYKDEDLAAEARSAFDRGLQLEALDLTNATAADLLRLANKAAELEASDTLRYGWLHEGWWRQWQELRVQKDVPQAAWEELLAGIARDLPGSQKPLNPPQPKLRERYLDDPLAAYREADQDTREKLHRILLSEIVLNRLERSASPDGRNADEIARQIDEQLPEQHAVAEAYRERHLAWRLSRVPFFTRQEALDLAAEFRRRNQPDQARKVLRQWIEARADRLRGDGSPGYLQLAEEYIQLLEDERAAAKVLIAGYQIDPTLEDISARLRRLGYQLHGERWLGPDELQNLPVDPLQKAMRAGEVIAGMTPEQVRSSVGAPTSIATLRTAGELIEVWSYGDHSGSGLTIQFRRTPRDDQLRVVRAQ